MTLTNEDLSAISEIMDAKLKTELQPLKDDVQVLKDDVQVLKDDVQVLKDDVQVLKDDVQVLKDDVQVLKDDVQVLKDDVHVLKDDVHVLKDEMHLVKLYQENVITPRLDTIEVCYADTYQRYQRHADRMEAAYDDIQILKKVVTEHSEQFQKLA